MVKLIKADFHGDATQFNDDGWFNATQVAKKNEKNINEWIRLPSTTSYIKALESKYGIIPYYKTKKGKNGGTYLHPKLGVVFARWISDEFAIWRDEQIEKIIHGDKSSIDWGLMRHASKSSNKAANDILKLTRQDQGKDTKHFHYANEARLVNFALIGKYDSIDRDSVSAHDLDPLAKLENRNSVLIARGVDLDTRREILVGMVDRKALE